MELGALKLPAFAGIRTSGVPTEAVRPTVVNRTVVLCALAGLKSARGGSFWVPAEGIGGAATAINYRFWPRGRRGAPRHRSFLDHTHQMRTGYEEGWAHDNIQSRGPGPELFRCFYTAFPASGPARLGVVGEPVPFPTQYQSTNPRAFQ